MFLCFLKRNLEQQGLSFGLGFDRNYVGAVAGHNQNIVEKKWGAVVKLEIIWTRWMHHNAYVYTLCEKNARIYTAQSGCFVFVRIQTRRSCFCPYSQAKVSCVTLAVHDRDKKVKLLCVQFILWLVEVMVWCQLAPGHRIDQWWLIVINTEAIQE